VVAVHVGARLDYLMGHEEDKVAEQKRFQSSNFDVKLLA
jgi:hypothetical protein